jgi:type IV pilus assembly protein PilF
MSARGAGVAFLAAAAMLAGCASNGNGQSSASDAGKDAARANVQLGVAYMQQGNLALAKEKLERALKQAPRSPEVHTALAFLNERLDRPQKAEEEYELAMKLGPVNSDVKNNYAVFLCRSGKVDKALLQFDAAAKDRLYSTPWAALTNAGVCLRGARRGPDAVGYLEQAVKVRPDYAAAVFELADLQLELGAPAVAGQVVDRYLAIGLVSPDVLLVGVRAALARDDKSAAQVYARRLRRDFPDAGQTKALPPLLGEKG